MSAPRTPEEALPLITLDPSSDADLERLRAAVASVPYVERYDTSRTVKKIMTALAGLPEPTACGTCVRDANGDHWTRIAVWRRPELCWAREGYLAVEIGVWRDVPQPATVTHFGPEEPRAGDGATDV